MKLTLIIYALKEKKIENLNKFTKQTINYNKLRLRRIWSHRSEKILTACKRENPRPSLPNVKQDLAYSFFAHFSSSYWHEVCPHRERNQILKSINSTPGAFSLTHLADFRVWFHIILCGYFHWDRGGRERKKCVFNVRILF